MFVPFYLRSNVFTMPEFLERRFNRASSVYLASISILAYIFTKISVHLYAAAIVLERVVGWDPLDGRGRCWSLQPASTRSSAGLSAVIYTELMQTLVLLAGAVVLTVIGLSEVGGFEGLRAAVPEHYFSMMKPADHPEFPWTGIFLGAPILGIWYWCTDQVIVQRVLSAKDEGHAKAGTIFAGLPQDPAGVRARAAGPDRVRAVSATVRRPKRTARSPTATSRIRRSSSICCRSGLVGLMIAALLAALMGGMASVFNSASTLVTLDFYKRVRPTASEKQLVFVGRDRHRVSRRARTAVGAVHQAAQLAALHLSADRVQAYISPPIAACFILGILWTRLNGAGSISCAADRIRARHAAVRAGSVRQERAFPGAPPCAGCST